MAIILTIFGLMTIFGKYNCQIETNKGYLTGKYLRRNEKHIVFAVCDKIIRSSLIFN